MHSEMQNTKQPEWQCHKIFHYPDFSNRSNIKCALSSPFCLCNTMRRQSATSSWEHFYRNRRERIVRNLRGLVYPLMSLLVCLRLSTRICGTLQTAHMCLMWGQHNECKQPETEHLCFSASTAHTQVTIQPRHAACSPYADELHMV